jgi:Spy/CpxP family protein refolding chaperone
MNAVAALFAAAAACCQIPLAFMPTCWSGAPWWLRLNEAALVAHWDGQISGVELGRRLQRLP